MANRIKYILLFSVISGLVFSCSKDEPAPATVAVSPKLLKEVKSVYYNQITKQPDSTILVYDYNDKGQIIKMTFKLDPGSYSLFEYNGDLPVTRKEYYNNVLVETQVNYASVSGNTIILTYVLDPTSTYDTIKRKFTLDGKNITQFQGLLINNTGDDLEARNNFTYVGDDLASTWYTSFLNGMQGSPGIVSSVKQRDDKFNPYSTLSPMNKAICAPVEEVTVHGVHNVLQFETSTSIGGLYEYTYDKDGYAITMKEPRVNGRFNTYIYNR